MPSSVPPFFHVGSPPRPAGFGNVRDSGYRCSGSTPEVRRAASRSGGALRCCSCPFEPGSLVPLVWLTEAPSRFRPSDQSTQPLAAHCPLPSPAAHCPLLLLLPSCVLPPTSAVAARFPSKYDSRRAPPLFPRSLFPQLSRSRTPLLLSSPSGRGGVYVKHAEHITLIDWE